MKLETTAKLRHLRMSPRKVRLVVDLVRGLKVGEAQVQLRMQSKDAAVPLLKLLNSAIANAKHNHEMDVETLVIKKAFVDGGPVLKRWMPRAMGRATPVRKRTSHIVFVLEGEAKDKKEVKVKKEETKKAKVKKVVNKKSKTVKE